jgi:hypothetical protein
VQAQRVISLSASDDFVVASFDVLESLFHVVAKFG